MRYINEREAFHWKAVNTHTLLSGEDKEREREREAIDRPSTGGPISRGDTGAVLEHHYCIFVLGLECIWKICEK